MDIKQNNTTYSPKGSIPDILYHYTTANALLGMLKEDENNKMCINLWETRYDFMNDRSEYMLGLRLVKEFVARLQITFPDMSGEMYNSFFFPYIISFSESQDCLPMWNMYGSNGKGISLGFSKDIGLNNTINQCVYCENELTENIAREFEEILSNDRLNDIEKVYFTFSKICSKIKNSSFQHEKEWRFIDFDTFGPIDGILKSFPNFMKFRERNGLIVPYKIIKFPTKHLKEIWIGPTANMDLSESSIRSFLDYNNLKNVNILRSQSPYFID